MYCVAESSCWGDRECGTPRCSTFVDLRNSLPRYHKVHPGFGGPAIILKNAGADATKGFRDAKHSPKAVAVQVGLLVGTLERNDVGGRDRQ